MPAESIQPYLSDRQTQLRELETALNNQMEDMGAELLKDLQAALGIPPLATDPDAPVTDTKKPTKKHLARVGDIHVGGNNIVPPGTKIEKGIAVGGRAKEKLLGTIARSDGYEASDKELARLSIQPGKELEAIKERVRRTAGNEAWQIDVVETVRGKELRGSMGDQKSTNKDKKKSSAKGGKQSHNDGQKPDAELDADDHDDADDDVKGSEETYKEEL